MNPRRRRLESDWARLRELSYQSTIFSFEVTHPMPSVGPPETYRVRFQGPSLQVASSTFQETVVPRHDHEVIIQLVADYPRSAPHMRWLTPIFHPNISAAGAVCLGGWGSHWAPSLQLDRLCEMLWDMLRFANYDTRSPFNQRAAVWLRNQREFRFPLDVRELRDRVNAGEVRGTSPTSKAGAASGSGAGGTTSPTFAANSATNADADIHFETPVRHHAPHPTGPAPHASREPASPQPDILFLD